MKNEALLSALAVLLLLSGCSSEPRWTDLIKGDLSGWVQLNGSAPFELMDGVVTGTAVIGSDNSFLCTKETFGDFILESDTWFDPRMNSGVQIRSVHGREAFMMKPAEAGEWNHCRVEAIGNSIRTWINGIPCADLVDALTPTGFIALQVHSIGNDEWRKMVAGSKYKEIPGFGETDEGRILLQDHGDTVSLRNIKIREIK